MKKDGGSAFPSCGADGCGPTGMKLRDYFAAMALQGIKSNDELLKRIMDSSNLPQQELIAQMAYADADAMLAERSK